MGVYPENRTCRSKVRRQTVIDFHPSIFLLLWCPHLMVPPRGMIGSLRFEIKTG